MLHPQGWEVGMEVCVVETISLRVKPKPRTDKITKVGRKWITTTCIHGFTTRFDADTMRIDGGQYPSPGIVYVDEEDYRQTTLKEELWKDFHSRLSLHAPDHFTVDDVRNIRSLVFPGLWDE